MIALSTIWGRTRFDSYPAMFLALRERFPAFELSLPPWPGQSLPRLEDFMKAGVKGAALSLEDRPSDDEDQDADGRAREKILARFAGAARAANRSKIMKVSLPGGHVPRPEGWGEFRKALAGCMAGKAGGGDAVQRGLAHRRAFWGKGLENLARTLFEITRAEPGLLFCVETPRDPSGLPGPQEFKELVKAVRSGNLRYCHVAGRAAYLEAVADWPGQEWMETAGGLTALVVLDDGGAEGSGRLPGRGTVSFRDLREQAPPSAGLLFRCPAEAGEEELVAALSFVESHGFS